MSSELKNIKDAVMQKIHHGEIRMHSRLYFLLGSVLAFGGVVVAIATSSFIFSLIFFSFRARGPMAGFKLQFLLANFPWWLSIAAIVALVAGLFLMRRYDFSYKIDFKVGVILLVLTVILSGWLIDLIGMNELISRRGPMKGMLRNYFPEYPTSMPGRR